ncbi:MAG: hypothetical protein ACLR0P_03930 [Oscillospiraceae bacterium]
MMAVCSFLGHRHIYGHDVQLRLQAAVNHLVEENDSVEFLLYLWKSTEPFYALCLLAALRAKQCAPQKVTLTLVADRFRAGTAFGRQMDSTRSFSSRTGCFRFPYPKTEIHSKS